MLRHNKRSTYVRQSIDPISTSLVLSGQVQRCKFHNKFNKSYNALSKFEGAVELNEALKTSKYVAFSREYVQIEEIFLKPVIF